MEKKDNDGEATRELDIKEIVRRLTEASSDLAGR